MNRDDIIRRYLNLHPDTPIDGQEYAVSLRLINYMLEASAAVEREECAKVCDRGDPMVKAAMTQFECAAAIRARSKQ